MNCPECGMPIKTVPAGISKKTGKPYQEFQACSNRNCDYKPPRDSKPLKSVPPGLSQASKEALTDTQSVLIGAKLDIIISLLREINKPKVNAVSKTTLKDPDWNENEINLDPELEDR